MNVGACHLPFMWGASYKRGFRGMTFKFHVSEQVNEKGRSMARHVDFGNYENENDILKHIDKRNNITLLYTVPF